MADLQPTFSVKVTPELRDKAQELLKASGLKGKEWLEHVIATLEIQSLKENATEYESDLNELETHTRRIYELTSNMIQRSDVLKKSTVRELETKLEQQREITSEFQTKIKQAIEEKDQANEQLKISLSEQEELNKRLEEIHKQLNTSTDLNEQLKEKNVTLSDLVAKYQEYADENEQLKNTLTTNQQKCQSAIDELTRQNNNQQNEIKALQAEIAAMKHQHELTLERAVEKKDIEYQKSLLQTERDHQKALTDANNEYTQKIKELYEELANERKVYEQKIEQLQQTKNHETAKKQNK